MFVFWFLRKINAVRRRLIGVDVPHWYKDAVGLIRHMNLLRLIPTLLVISTNPLHFFKSVPAILAGKKRHFLSPLQFVSNVAIVQLLILPHLYPSLRTPSKEMIVGINLATALVSPILVALSAGLILALWYVSMSIRPIGSISRQLGWRFNYHGCLLLLDAKTYGALDYRRYIWSMLYYYLYFYVVAAFILTASVFGMLGMLDLLANVGGGTIYIKLTMPFFALGSLAIAFLGSFLLLRPYIMLLLACSRAYTSRMILYLQHDSAA